jgi:hypothetical protein
MRGELSAGEGPWNERSIAKVLFEICRCAIFGNLGGISFALTRSN